MAEDIGFVPLMLASASSGVVSRIPMHPIDTCKAKLQVNNMHSLVCGGEVTPAPSAKVSTGTVRASLKKVIASTWKQEGLMGFYRGRDALVELWQNLTGNDVAWCAGIGVAVVGSAPASCLYFGTFEYAKIFFDQYSVTHKYPFLVTTTTPFML